MAFTIEMTPRGVLLAAKWRTDEQIKQMNSTDMRNVLVEFLTRHTKQPDADFRGLTDDDLVSKGAVVAFLREAGVAGDYPWKDMTGDDLRNNLIWQCNERTDFSVPELQGKTNRELIPIALDWLNKSRTGSRTWHPRGPLAQIVHLAGFLYDPAQDIIYSRMDALQRHFGYAYGYDDLAFLISAEIDCEPIFFEYNDKAWMIELWKGQYGLMCGCEIGVYNRSLKNASPHFALLDATVGKRPQDSNPSHNLFFECAKDDELLEMEYTLYTGRGKLFTRGPERHWWLTGFKWGELHAPSELTMIGKIKFPTQAMFHAFADAMKSMGYPENRASLFCNQRELSVEFTFNQPRTAWQPRKDPARVSTYSGVRAINGEIVSKYKQIRLPSNNPNLPKPISDEQMHMLSGWLTKIGQDFFLQALADLSKQVTLTLDELAKTLNLIFDFSCLVQIENSGPTAHSVRVEMIREEFGAFHGDYAVEPPQKIAPGDSGRFAMRPDLFGTAGWVVYSFKPTGGDAKVTQRFEYGCPTGLADNYARAQPTGYSPWVKSGTMTDWSREAKKGHPLKVAFVVGNQARPR